MTKGSRTACAFESNYRLTGDACLKERQLAPPSPSSHAGDRVSAAITRILTTSFVDGPGNRAVVFLQGCNLRCQYCHNPYTRGNCVACGDCVDACPHNALRLGCGVVYWDPAACQACDQCIRVCRYDSTPRTERLSSEEVWARIRPYAPFLTGVTASGGEPALHPSFLVALFAMVRQSSRLTTMIETNGIVPTETLRLLEPVMDGALVDLKAADPRVHKRLTGVDNSMCLESIRFLAARQKLVGVRQVVIPGFTDTAESAEETAVILSRIDPGIPLQFLRFRKHGTTGPALSWAEPDDACLDTLVAVARSAGLKDVGRSL